jgi:hypothetical protein
MFIGLLRSAFSAHAAPDSAKAMATQQTVRVFFKARKLLQEDMTRIVGSESA